MDNHVEFTFEVLEGAYDFKVESFQVSEAVSCPFSVTLSILSEANDITFEDLSRQTGVLTLFGQGSRSARQFNGLISELKYLGQGRRFTRYQITMVPHLWFLTQRSDCRIFQHQSAPDIIKAVLGDAHIDDYRLDLQGEYPAQEYVLQYRETDSQFIQRLLAEHGMWFYFEHTESAHTMVIVDSNDVIPDLISSPLNASYLGPVIYHAGGGGNADREHIYGLEQINRARTGHVSHSDYNYLTPNIPQVTESSGHLDTDLQLFDYPGRYTAPPAGKIRSDEWMSEFLVDNLQIDASSDVMRLVAGCSFHVSEHPRDSINRDYLMLSVSHMGYNPSVHEEESSEQPATYHNQFCCIPRDITYKAPKQPAPVVDGVQTAVVVGPEGEEIYTDEYGRIKVQFHWDRYGENNEHSSCWLRVSQVMAAPNWGAVYLPRIGHEVIVTFLEGDPDRPLVTGAVYNGLHQPPYALPEHKTRTVLRTQSHKAEGHNELYFEDEAQQEEIHFRAQKDMKTDVLNNRYRHIGNDEELTVGRDQENTIDGNRQETIDGVKTSITNQTFTETVEQDVTVTYNENETVNVANDRELTMGGHRKTAIGKNDELTVDGDQSSVVFESRSSEVAKEELLNVGGHLDVQVRGNTSIKSSAETTVISSDEIKVHVGSAGITLKKNGNISVYGSSIMVDGSANVKIQGGAVKINPSAAASRFVGVNMRPQIVKPKPEMTSESYAAITEAGNLMQELCQCDKGGVCQLHS